MTHHYDYAAGKTKAEKRERKKEKRRADMDAGKKAKLLYALAMRRAGVPDTGGRITKNTGSVPRRVSGHEGDDDQEGGE